MKACCHALAPADEAGTGIVRHMCWHNDLITSEVQECPQHPHLLSHVPLQLKILCFLKHDELRPLMAVCTQLRKTVRWREGS